MSKDIKESGPHSPGGEMKRHTRKELLVGHIWTEGIERVAERLQNLCNIYTRQRDGWTHALVGRIHDLPHRLAERAALIVNGARP